MTMRLFGPRPFTTKAACLRTSAARLAPGGALERSRFQLGSLGLVALLGCGLTLTACAAGGTAPSSGSSAGAGDTGSSADDDASADDTQAYQGTIDQPDIEAPDLDADTSAEFVGCAVTEQLAELTPVNLIILYDSSGSMGDSDTTEVYNLERRWNPAKAGMINFFENPGSPGIHASLKFFPHRGDFDVTCNPGNYGFPDVTLRSLDDPSAFITALNNKEPTGGTPMLPALMGAMEYATEKIVEDPYAKTVVVMITDGEPAVLRTAGDPVDPECPAGAAQLNTVEGVTEFVSAKFRSSPSIPTYVIGIGSDVSALGQIADAGGTEMVLIDDSDPENVQAQLEAAFQGIRTRNFDCSIDFPTLPPNQTVDFVNVDFISSSEITTPLVKAVNGCSAIGWTLDNEEDPNLIQLCEAACESVQTDPDGQLQITIGCATRVDAI